jgi:hypothetical protein
MYFSLKALLPHRRFSGVIFSVVSVRPKVHGFKPGRGGRFLKAIKIHSTPSFGGEVKPEAPYRKILRHVKNNLQCEQKYFARPNSYFPCPAYPACYEMTLLVGLPESSGGRIRCFPYQYHFTMALHTHISSGG